MRSFSPGVMDTAAVSWALSGCLRVRLWCCDVIFKQSNPVDVRRNSRVSAMKATCVVECHVRARLGSCCTKFISLTKGDNLLTTNLLPSHTPEQAPFRILLFAPLPFRKTS